MKSTIFIFLLLVTMSCQNSERKQIEQLVKEWTDREILLPEGPVFTRFATDTNPTCQIQGNRICGFGGLRQLQAPVTQMEGPDQRGGFIE